MMREPSHLVLSPESELLMQHDRCPSCALPKFKWTRTIKYNCCSVNCSKFFYGELVVATSWNDLRIKVFDRDNCICQGCGDKFNYWSLIADHIVPIAMGGPQWDINNIQTLCADKCNKIKTKKDAHDIAEYRRMNNMKRVRVLNREEKQQILEDAIDLGDLK